MAPSSVALLVLFVGIAVGIDSGFNQTESTAFYEVSSETQWKMKYCGSQPLPPWKHQVCRNFCNTDGLCRDFYCECSTDPPADRKCLPAEQDGKCDRFCQNNNLIHSYVCSNEPAKYYCICV